MLILTFLPSQVEKFIALWSSNKAFRADYESRILQSLDMRQFSKDGRIRNFDEKPLVQVETPTPVPSEKEVVKMKPPPKEEIVIPVQGDSSSEQKNAKPKTAKNNKEGNKKHEILDEEYEPEYFSSDKLQKKDEFDEIKMKELKREEEIAKRQQAEERKKKQAEKAAAKAAIKAQKEAEKKLKEFIYFFHFYIIS